MFNKLFTKRKNEEIFAYASGELIKIENVPDPIFSEKMMGEGIAILPSNGKVVAPTDGEIIMITETKHAIALKSCDGIELLIHIGMDTVKMNGKGFNPLVKTGEKVRCGQSLMTFSISDIEKAGYVTTTAIIVTNSDEYTDIEVLAQGHRKKSEKLIKIQENGLK